MIVLHVLGAGGATPTPERGPAAYWVELDGHGLLLDPGPGALVRLVRQPGAPDSVDGVDTVLLSHLHSTIRPTSRRCSSPSTRCSLGRTAGS
ncbi:MAG: hypothetical protein R3D98_09680 [Candidatus Krumholzibacteriia bacterium]